MKDDTSELGQMGRRRFARTLSAFGLSATTVQYLSQETLAKQTGSLRDRVPYVAYLASDNPDGVDDERDETGRAPIYETIEYEAWEHVQALHDAADQINDRLRALPGANLVRASVRRVTDGQNSKLVPNVEYTTLETRDGVQEPAISFDRVVSEVPSRVTGHVGTGSKKRVVDTYDVRFEQSTQRQQNYYTDKYRPVPGGCKLTKGGNTHVGTLGTPAYSNDLNEHTWVTAGHLFEDTDQRAHQPKEPFLGGNRIGYCHSRIEGAFHDSAVIDRDSEDDDLYDMAKDGGGTEGWLIDGIVTWDTILNKEEAGGWNLTLQGLATGRNSGELYDVYNGIGRSKYFKIRVASDDGDSGGPHFKKVTNDGMEYVYIAGIHMRGSEDPSIKDAQATAMSAIEDAQNVSVSTEEI